MSDIRRKITPLEHSFIIDDWNTLEISTTPENTEVSFISDNVSVVTLDEYQVSSLVYFLNNWLMIRKRITREQLAEGAEGERDE